MDDLISRKWLMECVDEGWIKFDTEKDTNTYIHLVRDIAPSAQPKTCAYWDRESNLCALHRPSAESRWIPVTERLPEDGAEVWVTTEMLSEVTRARWHKDSNLWCHPYNSDCLLVLRPIAWMEISLPKPYKGERDG